MGSVHTLWRSLFKKPNLRQQSIRAIAARREQLSAYGEEALRTAGRESKTVTDTIAVTAVVAARVLGLVLFDVQLEGALALADGRIAEMQTGEGKTLAAVPAIAWYAREGRGVHVMTANDYLARRDAEWMRPVYQFLELSVGCIQQAMTPAERRAAYACDITYATASEIGFDFLRDQLALYPDLQVHRSFHAAVVDEADSILIDEARIPLVIAGDNASAGAPAAFVANHDAYRIDEVTRDFRIRRHFTVDEYARNIALTDAGIAAIERALRLPTCSTKKISPC